MIRSKYRKIIKLYNLKVTSKSGDFVEYLNTISPRLQHSPGFWIRHFSGSPSYKVSFPNLKLSKEK